ncbi:hypothetical protein MSG28_006432 [Choristoneura fumiferana]|uniref:Uncharacterized protein n=1 Tax=Choristoneura fumiferana TaxID=7141 RepID=A0ACC0JEW4_CHOFU|nr:hypothetical protein MSG28_006432 [Choristoneura fumiferana]
MTPGSRLLGIRVSSTRTFTLPRLLNPFVVKEKSCASLIHSLPGDCQDVIRPTGRRSANRSSTQSFRSPSEGLAGELYNSEWTYGDQETKKLVLMFIMRLQKPFQLTAKKFAAHRISVLIYYARCTIQKGALIVKFLCKAGVGNAWPAGRMRPET